MISVSHWGMFEIELPRFVIPAGFKISEHDMSQALKPGGVIRIERVK